MTQSKLLVCLLVICANSLPFLWHNSFWKSVKDVCLVCCAISIGTVKCIWGECVDVSTKECTAFFKKLPYQPLKKLGEGLNHEVYAIGNTNLVLKSLNADDDADMSDYRFLTEQLIHRLPIHYGINRPICVMESNKNQYKVISKRVISLESHYFGGEKLYKKTLLYPILNKYKYIVHDVFTVLAQWIRKNSGVSVKDWMAQTQKFTFWDGNTFCTNIGLTLTGEPTFFDFDLGPDAQRITFDGRATSLPWLTEEIIENARKQLKTAMENPEWKAFTKEVLEFINFKLKKKFLTPSSKSTYD